MQPLRCLAGFPLSALPATSPADRQALSKPISQLMDPAGSPREGILLSAHGREHVPNPLPERAGEVSPARGAAALGGKINSYELEQPL